VPSTTFDVLYTGGNAFGASLVEGGDGRLYSAYYGGGFYGLGQIFSLNKAGTQRKVLKEFNSIKITPVAN